MSIHHKPDPNSVLPFVYHTNQILRTVVPCKRVCEIHNHIDVGHYLRQYKYTVDSYTTSQSFDASKYDFLVDYLSMFDADEATIGLMLGSYFELTALGSVHAIMTKECHDISPRLVYTVDQWYATLAQIGNVVQINHCKYWSMFLVTR